MLSAFPMVTLKPRKKLVPSKKVPVPVPYRLSIFFWENKKGHEKYKIRRKGGRGTVDRYRTIYGERGGGGSNVGRGNEMEKNEKVGGWDGEEKRREMAKRKAAQN